MLVLSILFILKLILLSDNSIGIISGNKYDIFNKIE